MMEVMVTTGAIRHVQSSSEVVITNTTQLVTVRMVFLSSNQQI